MKLNRRNLFKTLLLAPLAKTMGPLLPRDICTADWEQNLSSFSETTYWLDDWQPVIINMAWGGLPIVVDPYKPTEELKND